jgi:uncharacterized protein (DUF885 family)
MAPDEIHRTGLDLIAQQSAQADAILKAQGYTQGTVGQRLRALYDDPKFRYPNTDEGKDKLLADLNRQVEAMEARLPQYFGTLPKTKLDIRRVPKATEAARRAAITRTARSMARAPAPITSTCATPPKCRVGRCPR